MTTSLQDIALETITGGRTSLADYAGRVLLIVNTASACGLTPQYEGLEALQRKYGERGFTVLAFPSNQFGAQEPGTAAEIIAFCRSRFDASFPLFAKTDVNGPAAHPLYVALKAARAGADGQADIKWNFAKFLLGRDGRVLARYEPKAPPEALVSDIEEALEALPAGAARAPRAEPARSAA
jgi:glutathione peroxidase